jgi:hypothetical protein
MSDVPTRKARSNSLQRREELNRSNTDNYRLFLVSAGGPTPLMPTKDKSTIDFYSLKKPYKIAEKTSPAEETRCEYAYKMTFESGT